jgi:predicted glutamine amidotransferase
MCGLSGIAGSISGKDKDIFKNMLLFHSVRGEDSTGIGIVPRYKDQDIRTLKCLGPSIDLINQKPYERAISSGGHSVWLGHNRSATTGLVSIRNAHPFHFSNILGMHNGTLQTIARQKLKDYKEFTTDSEALIYNIGLDGPEKVIPLLEGSWTIVWYDQKTHSINMIRNEERPLVFAFNMAETTMYFGSELDLTAAAMRRNGVPWKDKFHVLPVNLWLSWDIPVLDKPFGEPHRKTLEGYKWEYKRVNHSTYSAETSATDNVVPSAFVKPGMGPQTPGTSTQMTTTDGSNVSGIIGASPRASRIDDSKKADFKPDPKGYFKNMFPFVQRSNFRILRDYKNNKWVTAL